MSRHDWAVADGDGNVVMFTWYCPGCDIYHGVPILDTKANQKWGFDGNWDEPTLWPSVLVNTTTPASAVVTDKYKHRCHVFIRKGEIQFLGDCTHEMKGQTVPLPTSDPWESDDEQ